MWARSEGRALRARALTRPSHSSGGRMRKTQHAVLTALEGAQSFLDQYAERFPQANASEMRRRLDEATTRLRQEQLEQGVATRLSRGASAIHSAARAALLRHHLQ